jgi:hypothetical protein
MISPDQMRHWVERAVPGESVAYCAGASSPAPEIAGIARALHEAGLVSLTSKREGQGFRFIAERRNAPLSALDQRRAPAINRGRFRAKKVVRRSAETVILRTLRHAAASGRPCPTNAELAALAGLSGATAASYRVRRLVRMGQIIVEEPSPCERRVVTIVATGQKTVRAPL